MLNAVIVDDEIPVLNLLKMFLEKTEQINIIRTFTNPSEALENMDEINPDIVFLDIEMPEMSGLELASHLIEKNDELMVVFVTGYNQYALEAFKVNALDYILKPVVPNTIQKCISRLIKLKAPRNEKKIMNIEKRICCFEDFKVYGDNGMIKWPTRKVEELMAYFIVNVDHRIEGGVLGELLWPEEDPDRIKVNLHTSIFRLRKTIKENNLPIEINSGKGTYCCSLNKLFCDLTEFKNIVSRNMTIDKNNIEEFERACLLYKDDLFLKKDYGWCEYEEEYSQQCYINILKNMASFYLVRGMYKDAVDKLMMIKRKSPFDEVNHQNILKIYAMQKNRALLIKCHEEFKEKLFKEMSITPMEETNKLFIKLLNGL